MENNFDILRRAGIKQQAVVALLRLNTDVDDSDIDDDAPIMAVTMQAQLR